MRWERHWWQKTEPLQLVKSEPTVFVDPGLFVEPRHKRMAQGTVPPPSCIGPHSELDEPTVVEAIAFVALCNPFV
jgi:hypothetical protein